MPTFLSPTWIAELDAAARADQSLADAAAGIRLVVEQRVTGTADGDLTYHVTLDGGSVAVRSGPADEPTIRFSQDLETAWDIATGRGSAQRAFMAGRLHVGGDLRALLDHGEALTAIGDVFATVRARTEEFSPAGAN